MLRDRNVFDKVKDLVNDVASFAKNLADSLIELIDRLPSPERLMQMASDFIKEKLLSDDGLCLAPSCGGTHINSGVEENLTPTVKGLQILASHHTTHADLPSQTTLVTPTHKSRPPDVTGAHHIVRLLRDV